MFVEDKDITPWLYRFLGEGFSRIRDDAPEWAKEIWKKHRATRTVAWDSPIKVE